MLLFDRGGQIQPLQCTVDVGECVDTVDVVLLETLCQGFVWNDAGYKGRIALDDVVLRLVSLAWVLGHLAIDHGQGRIVRAKDGCPQAVERRRHEPIDALGIGFAGVAVRLVLGDGRDLRPCAVLGVESLEQRGGGPAGRKGDERKFGACGRRRYRGRKRIGVVYGRLGRVRRRGR